MTSSDAGSPKELDRGWHSVESHRLEHWHYGEASDDNPHWASINVQEFPNSGEFAVEYYDRSDPCDRRGATSYGSVMEIVGEFMKKHEQSVEAGIIQ